MNNAERVRFKMEVTRLLQAGWNTGKVADWAVGAASGWGKFWNSRQQALEQCNAICREINRVRRMAHRNVARVFRAHGL